MGFTTGTNKGTGKAATLTIDGNVIDITTINGKPAAEWADATDSANYDPSTDTLYGAQKKGVVRLDLAISGNFDTTKTDADVLIPIITGTGTHQCTVTGIGGAKWADGTFDILDGDVKFNVPGATMATFDVNIRSNGKFTLY